MAPLHLIKGQLFAFLRGRGVFLRAFTIIGIFSLPLSGFGVDLLHRGPSES